MLERDNVVASLQSTVHWDEHNIACKKGCSNQIKIIFFIIFGLMIHTYLVLKPENMSKILEFFSVKKHCTNGLNRRFP